MLSVLVLADDVLGERDVGGAAGLQRDGVGAEVLQHVVHVREPEVLHAALPRLAQGHAEVLGATLDGGNGILMTYILIFFYKRNINIILTVVCSNRF